MPPLPSYLMNWQNQNLPVPDFTDKYNTKLSWEEELEFQLDMKDKLQDLKDYDLRGAWRELKAGTMKYDERQHLGDRYKKPNHPTFSNLSMYNGVDGYEGGEWSQDDTGKYTFKAGKNNFYAANGTLREYFREREAESDLIDVDGSRFSPQQEKQELLNHMINERIKANDLPLEQPLVDPIDLLMGVGGLGYKTLVKKVPFSRAFNEEAMSQLADHAIGLFF